MTLTEQTNAADNITIIADGSLQIREATSLLRDGVADTTFPPRYSRYVLHPGADLAGKDARIVAVANATWTADVVAAWEAAQAQAAD